jgi:hypothetical protein
VAEHSRVKNARTKREKARKYGSALLLVQAWRIESLYRICSPAEGQAGVG